VDEGERTRILEGMAAAIAEHGAEATVADALRRAGISGGAGGLSDREACVLATFDLGVERARARMQPAYELERRWLDAVRAGLAVFLRFLEDEPALGSVLVVHSQGAGPSVLRRRADVVAALAEIIDRGRHENHGRRSRPPQVIAEGVVGAVLAIVQNRLADQDSAPVTELFGPLASIVVLPYLGAGAARRELNRPMPPAREPPAAPPNGQRAAQQQALVRLTYRTARVLSAIADYPGASNREVADRAGIVDQGQVSKLLSRLEGRQLIARTGQDTTRGAPNSWCLTERGQQLLESAPGLR
jgi:hypothetical protein